MSEENKTPRTIRKTLDRKFGVSESREERRPRRDDKNGDDREFGRGRPRGLREDGSRREGRPGERRFDRERRPRRFDDRPFERSERFGRSDRRHDGDRPFRGFDKVSKPIYRQRPEQKSEINGDETLDESVLEARVAASEAPEASGSNPPWFKKLLALTTEKGREREGRFLGEGVHVVNELVTNHRELVIAVYAVEGFEDNALLDAHCRIANTKPVYESSRSVLTLVDAVQDPGNLGTLFRTSLGFGSDGMILGRGTVSPFNPKVVRGSSGTFLRVPFEFDVDLVDQINFLRSKGYTIIATDLHAKQSLRQIPERKLRKMAFLVGNEGAGTNPYFIELADETVKIPMSSELESLNVAVAHGILSYEAAQIQEDLK